MQSVRSAKPREGWRRGFQVAESLAAIPGLSAIPALHSNSHCDTITMPPTTAPVHRHSSAARRASANSMSTRPFVHLHCHSHYSLLDGASPINRLVARAKELGMNGLALTDHGNLHGALDFYSRPRKPASIRFSATRPTSPPIAASNAMPGR